MALSSPVAHRPTVLGLLALTFATGLVDAISVLVLGHVVAPVIALAALSAAAGLTILRHGPAPVPELSA